MPFYHLAKNAGSIRACIIGSGMAVRRLSPPAALSRSCHSHTVGDRPVPLVEQSQKKVQQSEKYFFNEQLDFLRLPNVTENVHWEREPRELRYIIHEVLEALDLLKAFNRDARSLTKHQREWLRFLLTDFHPPKTNDLESQQKKKYDFPHCKFYDTTFEFVKFLVREKWTWTLIENEFQLTARGMLNSVDELQQLLKTTRYKVTKGELKLPDERAD